MKEDLKGVPFEVRPPTCFIFTAMFAKLVPLLDSVSPTTVTLQLVVILTVIACSTRFISGKNYTSDLSSNDNNRPVRKVAIIPYWFPYLGHMLPFIINHDRFLQDSWYVKDRLVLLCRVTFDPAAADNHRPGSSH